MGLFAVACQLRLFPELMETPVFPVAPSGETRDFERQNRDGTQWLRSAIAYCNWRSGDSWRKIWRGTRERRNPDRLYYLGGVRLLTDILYSEPVVKPLVPQLVLPAINAEPGYSPEEIELSKQPAKRLVDELMAIDPSMTMRRSLLRLRRAKLARMLVKARQLAASAQPERRQA